MSELNNLLDEFDRRQQADRARETESKIEGDRFCLHFKEVRDRIILPAMEAAGRTWDERNRSHRIDSHNGKWARWLATSHPGGWLTFYCGKPVDEMTEEGVLARIGFLACPSEHKAVVYNTIVTPWGERVLASGATFALETITSVIVESEIAKVLRQCLRLQT